MMTMRKLILAFLSALVCTAGLAQTKVVAHRGARHDGAPYQNTIPALKFAQEVGVDAVEFDINVSSDDKIVVIHGPKYPGCDTKVQLQTFKQLRKAVLPGGTRIPTLKEWFKQAKKHPEITIILEVKKHPSKEKETRAVEYSMSLARKMKMGAQLQWTTFSEWAASEVKRLDPNAKVLFLVGGKDEVKSAAWAKEKGYELSYDKKVWKENPGILADCKALGVETTCWIVNDEPGIDWVLGQGFDYVSTDYPEKIKPYVDGIQSKKK